MLDHSLDMEKQESVTLEDPEKVQDVSTAESFDLGDRDEALRLVGLERSETFTEEQYLRVRRKLVRICSDLFRLHIDEV